MTEKQIKKDDQAEAMEVQPVKKVTLVLKESRSYRGVVKDAGTVVLEGVCSAGFTVADIDKAIQNRCVTAIIK